jgi:hypothetical protein
MPAFQTFLHAMNQLTARDQICELNIDNWGPGSRLSDRIRANLPGVELEGLAPEFLLYEELAQVIDALPPSIHDCLREIVRSGIERNQGITFAWRPAYDYKLEVTESFDTRTTYGGITVVLETRYPGDPHPLDRSDSKSAD